MSILSNVVLIGAGGTVGSHILSTLLSDPRFNITILTRPASESTWSTTFPTHERIKVVRTTYTPANLTGVFSGHDAVVSATGVTTFAAQADWIRAAHAAKVRRFVLNDFGNSLETQVGLPELEQFRVQKRQCLELARELAKRDSGREGLESSASTSTLTLLSKSASASASTSTSDSFSWSALATGNFIDLSLKKYPVFGFDVRARSARLVDDGSEPLSAVTLADIGRAVRGILVRPEETRNRYLHIRSVETCQREILAALERLTTVGGGENGEGKKWDVSCESSKAMLERGRAAFARGERSGMLDLLVVQLFQKGAGRSVVVGKDESDNELLGVEEQDIDAVVAGVLATFDTV